MHHSYIVTFGVAPSSNGQSSKQEIGLELWLALSLVLMN